MSKYFEEMYVKYKKKQFIIRTNKWKFQTIKNYYWNTI